MLIDFLKEKGRRVLYVETGREFRSFINEANYTSTLTQKALDRGELLPVWLPVWLWSEKFVRNFDGSQDLVLDGLARRMTEAPVLDSALKFYGREECAVVNINVSRAEAEKRLFARGRPDDTEHEKVQRRLDWYDRDVLDVIEYFKEKKGYTFYDINGEQSVDEVFHEMIQKLGFTSQ